MRIVTALIFLSTWPLHASITLATPFTFLIPVNGSLTVVTASTLACEGVDVDVLNGVASDVCYFCNDVTNSGKEVSCAQIPRTPQFSLKLIKSTGVLTVTYQGLLVATTTYAGAALTSAWNFDTQQPTNAIQNATELLFLPFNVSTNPSGLGIIPGGGAQNATW